MLEYPLIEDVFTIDCKTLAEKDPFDLIKDLGEKRRASPITEALYSCLLEGYILVLMNEASKTTRASVLAGAENSSLVIEYSGCKVTCTDNNREEKINIVYDAREKEVYESVRLLCSVFKAMAQGHYALRESHQQKEAAAMYKTEETTLVLGKNEGNIFLHFNGKHEKRYLVELT